MRHNFARPGIAVVVLAILTLATGCSKSPTGPSDSGGGAGGSAVMDITVEGSLSIPAGATSQLTARAKKSDGSTEDVTGQASWSSSDPAVATVSATGLVTSLKEGAVSMTARFGSRAGTGAMTITAALYDVTITPTAVEALSSCDDVLQGSTNGEFAFSVDVQLLDGTVVPVFSTANYPGNPLVTEYWNVTGGGSRAINAKKTVTLAGNSSEFATVKFRATEWDTALLGAVWLPDSRMNDRSLSRSHKFSNGTLSNEGANSLQLGDAACGIRLLYTVTSVRK